MEPDEARLTVYQVSLKFGMREHEYECNMMEQKNYFRQGWILVGGIGVFLAIASWVGIQWDLDRTISSRFYSPEQGWFLRDSQPWKFLYEYGTIPGLLLTIGSLVLWFITLGNSRFGKWNRHFLLIFLVAFIGGGVIVNAFLKDYWGRPRPREIQDFGGKWSYKHVIQPGTPGQGHSFPCGHCTMGYLFVTFVFFREHSRLLAYLGSGFGFLYGILMSIGRVVQGAHFSLDALWSLGVITLVSIIIYFFVLRIPAHKNDYIIKITLKRKIVLGAGITVLTLAIITAFMTRRPFYKTYRHSFKLPTDVERISIHSNFDLTQSLIEFQDIKKNLVYLNAQGFGWPTSSHRIKRSEHQEKGVLYVDYQMNSEGYFAELNHSIQLILPHFLENKVEIEFSVRP